MESAWPLLPRGQLLGERALAVPTLRAGEDQTSQNAEMSTFDHGLSGWGYPSAPLASDG